MNSWDIRLTEQSDEWSYDTDETEVELVRECHDGSDHCIFLTKKDLEEMLKGLK